jgi:hypothetical protein
VSNIAIMMSLVAQARKCSNGAAAARSGRAPPARIGVWRGVSCAARDATGGSTITNSEFSAVATSWHDFYLTAGAASATLIGLLFVGLSINLDEFTSDSGVDLRLLAEQAFANFIFVLLIALFVLVPNQDAISFTIEMVVIGVAGGTRMVRRIRAFRRRRDDPFGGWVYIVRRLGFPGAASLGLIGVGMLTLSDPFSAFFWLLGFILVYLMSAADTTWDLLIEVGRQRHRTS